VKNEIKMLRQSLPKSPTRGQSFNVFYVTPSMHSQSSDSLATNSFIGATLLRLISSFGAIGTIK
ncbi:MAG: hypothetical protein AB1777_12315, partial [Bacteroidota bacterium]